MSEAAILKRFKEAQESLVIQSSDFSLLTISQMVVNGSINLSPHYQRRDRWNGVKQSKLIESFILNVPVPPVYLAEEEYGDYSVIDGKQRITAISNYLDNQYKLSGLDNFDELNGKYFKDLPQAIRNALSVRPYLRVVTLLRQSDPNLKYEVFLRLNTGGELLKPQEIRNVAFDGTFNRLLYDLSENEILKMKLNIKSEKSPSYRKMEDLELILRFFTLSSRYREMSGVLSKAMNDYMSDNKQADKNTIENLRLLFNNTIDTCNTFWPNVLFNKPIANDSWRSQLISPLYDAQMVAVTLLTSEQIEELKEIPTQIIQMTRELFKTNEEFVNATTQATNNRTNIVARIEIMRDSLLALL